MPSWYSSWLPGLPALNLAIPSSLQGRFVSFLLKKCLGHFLKPGQLDVRQIESQIGSGFVQVNDLELNDEAINSFLAGLPLSLHDGYISSVTARVPWPNPLTSNLGLSLDALHLTFHVVPIPVTAREPDLAESVASIADSFVHEELTEQENTALRESVHLDTVSDTEGAIPGALDPFLSNNEEAVFQGEQDPAGVSLFSTLAEKLLARFEFSAVNTKVTIIHEGNVNLTICIPEICYGTEVKHNSDDANLSSRDRRALTVSGITITSRNLRSSTEAPAPESWSPSTPRSPSLPAHRPHPASPATSSSSLDEETQALMSHSVVALPPRPSSPAGSISSSLYQSALSEGVGQANMASSSKPVPQISDTATSSPGSSHLMLSKEATFEEGACGDVLLSFGSIHIQAPLLPETNKDETSQDGHLAVSMTIGLIACALHAWQLAGILEMTAFFAAQSNSKPPPPAATGSRESAMTSSSPAPTWLLDINLEGLVALVLPVNHDLPKTCLTAFFVDPLKPPSLPCGYLRLFVGDIALTTNSGESFLDAAHRGNLSTEKNLIYELSCADIDASVYPFPNSTAGILVSPILSVDQQLLGQYSVPSHRPDGGAMVPPLPTFRANDWLGANVRDPEPLPGDMPDSPGVNEERLPDPSTKNRKVPAILVRVENAGVPRRGANALVKQVSVGVLPINIFLDVGELVGNTVVTTFLNELAQHTSKPSIEKVDDGVVSDDEELGDTPPATAKVHSFAEQETERKRLERLVMEDLGLSINLPAPDPTHIRIPRRKRRVKSSPQTSIVLTFSMIRVHVRCLPLPGQSPRSGRLFADIHQLELTFGERHSNSPSSPIHSSRDQVSPEPRLLLKCGTVVFALSPVGGNIAITIAFITSLDDDNDLESTGDPNLVREPLKPRISVLNAAHSATAVPMTILDLNIPFIYVNLTKEALDGLLFLADDVNQLLEGASSQQVANASRSPSLKSHKETLDGADNLPSSAIGNALEVRASVTEVAARLMVTRSDEDGSKERPLDILASDLLISLEASPDNAEQSVANIEMMELSVKNMNSLLVFETILSRTAPRNMSSLPKPALKLTVASSTLPDTKAKSTKLTATLWGFTNSLPLDTQWLKDINAFVKSPPGVFEAVVPSESTSVILKLQESSLHVFSPTHPGRIVLYLGELEFMTDIVGNAPENNFRLVIPSLSLLTTDDIASCEDVSTTHQRSGVSYLKTCGYALIAEIMDSVLSYSTRPNKTSDKRVEVEKANLRLHLCADTLTATSSIISDWQRHFSTGVTEESSVKQTVPAMISELYSPPASLISSVDEFTFRRATEIGPAADMINDDLPTNLDYLDESFSAAAGLREFSDEDLDDFKNDSDFEVDLASSTSERRSDGITSRVGGETVKMMQPEGIRVIEGYFESLPNEASVESPKLGNTSMCIRIYNCNLTLYLYDGYDWAKTRKTIEEEVKDMRRRLARLRQLVASGQTPDPSMDEMSAVLFNSVYIGLVQDAEDLEPGALIAAIDEQLDDEVDTASQSSWQSLRHTSGRRKPKSIRVHGKRLTRSKGPSMEFVFAGVKAEIDYYHPSDALLSRNFFTVRDVEIFDHIKTSTWRKFLTALQLDSRGNTRETGSNMIQVELQNVHPVSGHPSEEVRLRAKILPLRLYVDQDAVDFLKKFFSFKDPRATPEVATSANQDTFIQLAEVFPVLLKLDYKPRRVDYKALREGRTIELMNFFHFDGAEMTLRHITLTGIMGWARMFELLNDLWTPDVKATQLVDVISGVAPIRSVVNVGSGVADLVLLPIAQYKKDGRILRGLQKGTTAFFKSTALEAVKLGAKLATGTQVILEQAEGVLGGQFQQSLTTETIPEDADTKMDDISDDEGTLDVISKYAEQPMDLKEGVHSAYRSLRKNFGSAAQTILAVPMEVYERSGDEGAIRSVIRAVPIAVLKPMIGATEAVSKTLLGLHNTLDSNVWHDNEAKYKHR